MMTNNNYLKNKIFLSFRYLRGVTKL